MANVHKTKIEQNGNQRKWAGPSSVIPVIGQLFVGMFYGEMCSERVVDIALCVAWMLKMGYLNKITFTFKFPSDQLVLFR